MANQVVYGFEHLADRFADRVTEVGVDVVDTAITQAIEEHNRQMAAFTALFVQPTTAFKTVYKTSSVTRNQPLDEWGRPLPIKPAGKYEVGFPIYDSGNAYGWNWQSGLKATVEEVNRAIQTIEDGDRNWIFDHILAALYHNASWTFTDDDHGDLTVQSLANADDVTYNVFSGAFSGATDDHYAAQANAIGAGADNPYPAIYTELAEHPENGAGKVVSFIPTGLRATTEALATFNPVADPNIRRGIGNDELVGNLGVNAPGTLLGYEDGGAWIVEWPRLPAGYIVSIATGGPPPVAMREDELATLRGFVEMPARADQPYYSRSWLRKAGFGGWNRVGAHIQRIGNGTYAVPTGFSQPMP